MKDGLMMKTRKKWSWQEQGYFLKRMGELLERGYSFSDSIESLVYHLPVKHHQDLLNCLEALKSGQPLYSVLEKLQFQKDLVGYIYFADQHGGMVEAISEGSNMILKKSLHLQKMKKALFYPLFLFVMTTLLFFFVERTLLPQFSSIHDSMDLEENIFTKMITLVGTLIPIIAQLFLLLIVFLCIFHLAYFRRLPIMTQRKILVNLPLLGTTLRITQTHYFALQLGYLLTGGLSVSEALQLFENAPRSDFYRELGREIARKLKKGEELSRILGEMNVFEREFANVVKHGQSNGKLEKELLFFSVNCLEKLEGRMAIMLALIQPILYGFVGLLVVTMYLSIMLPMFELINGI